MVVDLIPTCPALERAKPDHDPEVAVIAVTYNSADIIQPFLEALPAALEGVDSATVTIVDNASADETTGIIRSRAPWARLVEAGDNVGYAAGINLGMRSGLGSVGIYVLNPDAVPSPGSIVRLRDAVSRDRTVGIAVPKIVDDLGALKYSLRREPTLLRAAGEALLGGHRAARFRVLGEMIRNPAHYRDGATADWATGAALFVSRAAIEEVGGWDEQFFLYSEEADYALRAGDRKLVLRYIEAAVVSHPGGDMEVSPYLWSLVAGNRVKLYRKRHGVVASTAYWCAVVLNEAARAILGRPTNRAALRALLRLGPTPDVAPQIPSFSALDREQQRGA